MTTHVAILRAVNVGPHDHVGMADSRELSTKLGLSGPRSLLQSGNLVFESDGRTTARLEELLESTVKQRFGMETDLAAPMIALMLAISSSTGL